MTLHRTLLVTILVVSAYLSLVRLNAPAFWDDEAHVALFARNFLKTGHWSAWDGRNLIAYGNGQFLDPQLHELMPQPDSRLVAASFWCFGISTWTARLPFALAGLLGLFAFLRLLRLEFPGNPTLELYALASLALSTNFLLYVRTCRYYAVSLLFVTIGCVCYRRFLTTRRFAFAAGIGLAGSALFLTSALNCAAFLFALGLRHLVFHRKELDRGGWLKMAGGAALFLCGALPYLVCCVLPFSAAARAYTVSGGVAPEPWFMSRWVLCWWNIREINAMNALPWSLAAGLGYFLVSKFKEGESVMPVAREWVVMAMAFTFFTVVLSPQVTWVRPVADIRYLVPILPVLAGLVAVVLWRVHQWSKILAIGMLAMSLSCNALAWVPGTTRWLWLLPALGGEVHRPYPTACSETENFLRTHATQDETVWICPNYMNKPLMFYLSDKLRFAGTFDRRTPLPMAALRQLNAPLFIEESFPDWIVAFGAQPELVKVLAFFSRPYTQNGVTRHFLYHQLASLEVYYDQAHRPELPGHSFGPRQTFDRDSQGVYIFRRGEAVEDALPSSLP